MRTIVIWLVLFVVLSLAATMYFSFNQKLYTDIIIANLWKKPFVYISSIIYVFFPYLADTVYVNFLKIRYLLSLIFYPSAILFITLFFFRKIKLSRGFLLFSAIYVFSGYPVLFLSIQARLLQPQLIIFSVVLAVYASRYIKKEFLHAVFLFLIITNIIFSYKTMNDLKILAENKKKEVACINKMYAESGKKKLLLLNNNFDYISYPYEMYFDRYNEFGRLDGVYFTPLPFISIKSYDFERLNDSSALTLKVNYDTITVSSRKDFYVMNHEYLPSDESPIFELSSSISGRLKNFSSISVLIPKNIRREEYLCLFYNGKEWKMVDI